jgi:exopolyphosphatase / guanosine-5'-triphosphate,3'-diphosphate pyrophosphatase
MMRKAVIDLGTNTFNLLIADVREKGFELIHSEKDGVALGMGGINQGYLSEEAFERGIVTLTRFKNTCEQHHVVEIHAIGTSALRGATNADEFIQKVRRDLGFDIEIISGLREAQLIYNGVRWSYDFQDPGVIMDIGGGSTEFIFADSTGVRDMISLNIGVSRIYQQFACSDPLTAQDVTTIENWLEERAEGFFEGKQSDLLIGASGSFETFYELVHLTAFPEKIKSVSVPFDEIVQSLDEIISSTQADRDKNPWIIPIRKKMAPIAAVKTRWVIRKLQVKKIIISPCSLKEGVLVD